MKVIKQALVVMALMHAVVAAWAIPVIGTDHHRCHKSADPCPDSLKPGRPAPKSRA